MKNKKGSIEGLQALIVPLIAIGIILVVGFLIFSEVKEKVIDITAVATTHINESFTGWTSGTYKTLTHMTCMTLSCSALRNTTSDVLPTTMYNCTNKEGIQVTNASADALGATLYVDYSCTNRTIAYNATSDVQNAIQDIPGWLPIIIITIIGALLIGLVTRFRAAR